MPEPAPLVHPDRDPGLAIAPEAMALVFYTSGSTGEPKGVIQMHRNLLQTARLYANGVELRPSDRVFCPMPLAYAGGVWGLLASLMSGAAFCRGSAEAQTDVAGQLIRQEITVAQLMVSMLRNLLLSASGRERFPTLREVFTGGGWRVPSPCPSSAGLASPWDLPGHGCCIFPGDSEGM